MSTQVNVKTLKTGFWHMPKTFYAVMLVEFWERFAFLGLQSIALVYFIQYFAMSDATANGLFGSFAALLYVSLTIGGIIGDKVIGLRRTYCLGIIFLTIGYIMLALSHTLGSLYPALGVVLVGNVFFKTNAANYVSRCFESNDPRLDSAFTYFYMSVNAGGILSMILVPVMAKAYGNQVGLGICAVSMLFALATFTCYRSRFHLADNQVGIHKSNLWVKTLIVAILGVFMALILAWFLSNADLSKTVIYIIAIVIIVIYLTIAARLNRYEAKGMYVALILLLQAIIFWILYIQQITSVTLFALHNVRLSFWGYTLHPGITQVLDPIFILIFSPILANLYIRMYKDGTSFEVPTKFLLGIAITGLCFITLGVSASYFADQNGQVSALWLIIAYSLFALGELLVSALGPSMISKLLPKRFGGFAQGAWFLATAIGMKVGTQMSSNSASVHIVANNFITLDSYIALFYKLGIASGIIAIMCFLILKPLTQAFNEVISRRY